MKEITPAVFRETVAKVAPGAIVQEREWPEYFGNANYKKVRIYLLYHPHKHISITHFSGVTTLDVSVSCQYSEVVTPELRCEIAEAMGNATAIMEAIAKLHAKDDI